MVSKENFSPGEKFQFQNQNDKMQLIQEIF